MGRKRHGLPTSLRRKATSDSTLAPSWALPDAPRPRRDRLRGAKALRLPPCTVETRGLDGPAEARGPAVAPLRRAVNGYCHGFRAKRGAGSRTRLACGP